MTNKDMLFIGIAGGTGSGKTTLAEHVCKAFGDDIAIIAHDSYYLDQSEKSYDRYLRNHNKMLVLYDGCTGVKTGFTNGANRCLVTSVKRDNMDLICIVLGADTKKDRTKDSIQLIEYAFKNFEMINIKEKKELVDMFDLTSRLYSVIDNKKRFNRDIISIHLSAFIFVLNYDY